MPIYFDQIIVRVKAYVRIFGTWTFSESYITISTPLGKNVKIPSEFKILSFKDAIHENSVPN